MQHALNLRFEAKACPQLVLGGDDDDEAEYHAVRPSPVRLLASLGIMVAGGAGLICGLLLILGLRTMQTLVVAGVVAVGLSVALFLLALIRQRPQVVVSAEGFVFCRLFGSQSRKWEEVDGQFAVIKIGLSKAVAYNLTAECKARTGRKPTSHWSGYDEAILAQALQLWAEQLAELLNEYRR
jgi:hypothetical protein